MRIMGFVFLLITTAFMNMRVLAANQSTETVKANAEMAKLFINDSLNNTNVKFYNVCKGGAPANSFCVRDFEDVKVQPFTAVGLAKEWALEKHKQKIICQPSYRTEYFLNPPANDDFIQCTSANGKTFYEFRFDSVVSSVDSVIVAGKTRGVLKILEANDLTGNRVTTVKNETISNCQNSLGMANKFGLSVEFFKANHESIYISWPDHCAVKPTYEKERNDLAGLVDNTVFKNLQTQLGFDLTATIGAYVSRVLLQNNIETDKFWCDYSPRSNIKRSESSLDPDDILRCYVKVVNEVYTTPAGVKQRLSGNGTYTIDFKFNDLSEAWDKYSKGAESAMACISKTDGTYDGRKCVGLNQAQCMTLRTKSNTNPNPIETEWKNGSCVLTAANSAANIARTIEVASSVGVAAGVLVATIVTGGTSTMVLLAAAGLTTSVLSETVVTVEREYIENFTKNLKSCTARPCFKRYFDEFIDKGSNYIGNLTDDQISAIDQIMADCIKKYSDGPQDRKDFLAALKKANNKGVVDRCLGDRLQTAKCGLDVATIVLDFLPVTKAATSGFSAVAKLSEKMGNKMPLTMMAITEKIELLRNTRTVKTVMSGIDRTATITDIALAFGVQ